MKNLLKIFTVLAVALFLSASALAQMTSGDLNGVVRDPSGAVVANATIEATNLATGAKSTTKTNSAGEYYLGNMPPGHYSLVVTSASLKGGVSDVEITLNKTGTANITTSVAGTATSIEVSGLLTTVDTSTAQIQNTFEAKQLVDLPTASTGLGVLNLSLLNAGVASSGGVGAGTGPSVSGQRPRNNNFTIEGVDNNDKGVTGPLITVPNDAVEQFTVLQNNFSPEFGHSSGGQFNQTIKGGTNQFHGKAYEYFQNRDLNAIDSLNARGQVASGETPFNPRYDNNRFGGQIGGPIWKNHMFFFTNWDYNPIGQASTASTISAPTAAGYAMFATRYSGNNLATLQKYLPAASSNNAGFICLVPLNAAGACPQGQDIVPVGNVSFSGPAYNNFLTGTNSFDWNISQKDSFRFRWIYNRGSYIDTAAQVPTFWATIPTRYQLITGSEYHQFSNTISNEFRFGYNRYAAPLPCGNQTFPGMNVFPNLQFNDLQQVQLGCDPNLPQSTVQNLYSLVENLTWVKGRHTFKFGGEFRDSISPQQFTQRVRGDYEYTSTALYLADLTPDYLAERSQGLPTYYGNQLSWYFYGNDQWKVTPRLTLSLGLRYEWTATPLSYSYQNLNAIASVPGVATFGSSVASDSQKTNFMPRVGFAYTLNDAGTTVVRGGFAMANDVLYDNIGLTQNPWELSATCDAPGVQTSGCYWKDIGFLANGGLPFVFGTQDPGTPANARANTSSYIPKQQLPYSESWNLGVQHSFGKSYVLEIRYVGTKGIHLPVQDRLNRQDVITQSFSLPTFMTNPGLAVANALPVTLAQIAAATAAHGGYVPYWYNAGFHSNVVGFMPYGQSNYNGMQAQFTRNFTNGLQFVAAWTWSHAFDDATADFFSTVITPRRPQNFQCILCDMSTSALDRRHRITIQAVYDLPFFKNDSNWLKKNLIGNWEFAPVYTFQSPEYATVQTGSDANLNGDSAGDRAYYNPAGVPNTGSGVTALKNSNGDTVGYVANNPTAQYVALGSGAWSTTPRNSLQMPRINNFDMTLLKRVNITERQSIEFQCQAMNLFNHAQYIAGSINQINSIGYTGTQVNTLRPSNVDFTAWNKYFSNNPRSLTLVLKYIF